MPAKLLVKAGLTDSKEYLLEPGKTYTVGRARESDIVIKDQRASRRHCTLEASSDGEWTLTDNKSSNGTYVNRQRITSRPLRDGDIVQVGQATFGFQANAAAAPAASTEPEPAEAPAEAAKPAPKPAPAPAEKPEAAGAPAPKAPEATPEPSPEAKSADAESEDDLDEELKGLFEFLDRIDADRQEAPAKKPRPPSADKKPDKPKENGDALFSLGSDDKSAAPAPKQPSPPNEEKQDEPKEGGLLDFLRKKKQD